LLAAEKYPISSPPVTPQERNIKDGNGLNVELKAMPVSGKLVIRRHDGKVCANEA